MDADINEAAVGEEAWDKIPDRIVTFAQCRLASLTDELKPHASDNLVHRIVKTKRVKDERARNIVGFSMRPPGRATRII
jgi:hypothetical protein